MTTQRRAIIGLGVFYFVVMLAGVTGSIIAYIAQSYPHVDQNTVTLIMTLPTLVGIFVSFAIGPIALKVNKKLLMVITLSFNVVYFAVLAFVGANGPFEALLVAAALSGICGGAWNALCSSYIGEFFPPEKRPTMIAIFTAVCNVGGTLMNLIGGPIAAMNDGANWPSAYLLGLITIPAIIIFCIIMPKKADAPAEEFAGGPAGGAEQKAKIPVKVFIVIGLAAVFSLAVCVFLFNVSYYVIAEFGLGSSTEASWVNSTFTVVGVIVGFSYAIWAKLFGKYMMLAGYIIMALGFASMAFFTTNIAGIFIAAALIGFGFNASNPYLTGYLMQLVQPRLIPVVMSIFMGVINFVMFVSPYVLDTIGIPFGGGLQGKMFGATAIAVICAVVCQFIFTDTKKKIDAANEQ